MLLPTFKFLKFFFRITNRSVTRAREEDGLPSKQIRSSAWLEHYTDNVGVTSSNLVGSTSTAGAVAKEGTVS
jgi:hypothetical protein